MSYKEDLQELKLVKLRYPKILIGVIDPRGKNSIEPYVNYKEQIWKLTDIFFR